MMVRLCELADQAAAQRGVVGDAHEAVAAGVDDDRAVGATAAATRSSKPSSSTFDSAPSMRRCTGTTNSVGSSVSP